MEKKYLLSIFTFLLLMLGLGNEVLAQTDCELTCPLGVVAASYDLDDGYTVVDFLADSTVQLSPNCADGEFIQSPAPGEILTMGAYEVTVQLIFEGDTSTCTFDLNVDDNPGGGKCVVVCPEYLYVEPDSAGSYSLPNFFQNETIFFGSCELSQLNQSPPEGTIVTGETGDSLQVYLNYNLDGFADTCFFWLLIDESTAVDEATDEMEIMLYPNPARHMVHVDSPEKINQVVFYDITGKKVFSTKLQDIDVSLLNKGMYFVEINTRNQSSTKRLLIE